MSEEYAIVLTTWPADADADAAEFAETLVRDRLAACVNVLPEMQSTYTWKGQVERATERQVVMKTSASRLNDLKARIASLHPHEVPELLVLRVQDGGQAYLDWIRDATR